MPGCLHIRGWKPHICVVIKTPLLGCVTSISLGRARDDIFGFLRVRLSENETIDGMNESLVTEILEKIRGSI